MVARFRAVLDPPYSMSDQKAHHFLPGEVLSGRVIYTAKDGEKIKNISATFKGWLFAQTTQGIVKGSYHFDILSRSKILLQGPVKMAASTCEYPFFLEIHREFASPVAYTGYSKPSDFLPSPPGAMWPIPPTCEDAVRLTDTYNDWKIIYSLVARAEKTMLSLKDEIPIVVTTPRSTLNPSLDLVRQDARDGFVQNYTFTNVGLPRALTKTESLKETMTHSANYYRLNLSLLAAPTTPVIVGQPFTLRFVLQSDTPESSYQMPIPEFQLRDYAVCLSSTTNVSVPHANSFLAAVAMSRVELFPKKRFVNCPLLLNEPVMMQETLPSAFKSPPSFKSFLVERRYYFQIEAHVACFDHTTKLKILLPFWWHSARVQGQPAPTATFVHG